MDFIRRVKEDGELISAYPGNDIRVAETDRQDVGGTGEQNISLLVAQGVVDQFQPVHVEHDESDGTFSAFVDALHLFFKISPVIQTRQAVMKILVLQQLFRLLAIRYFALGFPEEKGVFIGNRGQVGNLIQHGEIIFLKLTACFRMPQPDNADNFSSAFQRKIHDRFG